MFSAIMYTILHLEKHKMQKIKTVISTLKNRLYESCCLEKISQYYSLMANYVQYLARRRFFYTVIVEETPSEGNLFAPVFFLGKTHSKCGKSKQLSRAKNTIGYLK